jgi:hypothetical protein
MAALCCLAPGGAAGQSESRPPEPVSFRGRAVCLDAEGKPFAPGELCDAGAARFHRFGLLTAEGKVVSFSPRDNRAEMFTDHRVRDRELEVHGWPAADGHLAITRILSWRDGQLFDMYYFCDVCNIKSNTPGPCWCCRQDFDFREAPVNPSR